MNLPTTSQAPSNLTVTVAAIAVANAIKTSIATSTSAQNYTTFNGALGGGPFAVPRTVSVTSSSHSGSYTTASPIVFTGTDADGAVISENLSLTATAGGETISGSKAFKSITSIAVPAQTDTSGAFTFGVVNIAAQPRHIRCGGTGNLSLKYENGSTDTITGVAAGETLSICPVQILGSSTVTNVTLLF